MTPEMVAKGMAREKIITAIEQLPFGPTATSLMARVTRNPNKK